MRIFFIQKAHGLFASSGEYRANISFLRHLANLGHATAQVCYYHEGEVESCIKEVEAAGRSANLVKDTVQFLSENGDTVPVDVSTFTNIDGIKMIAFDAEGFKKVFPQKLYAKETIDYIDKEMLSSRLHKFMLVLNSHLTIFESTHIIFNDSLSLKGTISMHYGGNARRVFVIHCAEQLPFGPYAGGLADSACSAKEHDLLHEVDAIWSVSNAVKDYAAKYGQLETTFLAHDPWTYLDERTHQVPERYYNWDKELVGMINPSQVKGVKILLQLAKALPDIKFAAWRSWGADDSIEKELEVLPNIELRPTCRNMEDAWKDIKVLLVPSLWLEAWGMVVIEAQIRGIPVISSDSGALPEAKLGIAPIIPVNSLTGEHDKKGDYIVPNQDITPWVTILELLMKDKEAYDSMCDQARKGTAEWLTGQDEHGLEQWLENIEEVKA